jgi:hypothetical protein
MPDMKPGETARVPAAESSMKLLAICVTFVIAWPVAAKQKKSAGEVTDKAAFAKIQSYCVDLTGLEDYETYDVRGFIRRESQAGKLLTKIPWRLDKDCRDSDSDAIVELKFPRQRVTRLGSGPTIGAGTDGNGPGNQGQTPPVVIGGSEPLYHTVAVLRVISRQTSGQIYKCQADPLSPEGDDSGPDASADTIQRRNATYGAFWTLAQDIKRISP